MTDVGSRGRSQLVASSVVYKTSYLTMFSTMRMFGSLEIISVVGLTMEVAPQKFTSSVRLSRAHKLSDMIILYNIRIRKGASKWQHELPDLTSANLSVYTPLNHSHFLLSRSAPSQSNSLAYVLSKSLSSCRQTSEHSFPMSRMLTQF